MRILFIQPRVGIGDFVGDLVGRLVAAGIFSSISGFEIVADAAELVLSIL